LGIKQTSRDESEPNLSPSLSGTNQAMWVVWWTYGAFYFCRTNISAAVPGLLDSVENGGLRFTTSQVGFILGSTKIAYAAGQLINGQLSEHLSPRRMLAIGMLGTAALNVLFGMGTAFYFLIFIWACNGYSQSLGWTPCVRVLANWFPIAGRGRVIGLVGTGYQVTASLTFALSGWAADSFGWRGALFVPAGLMLASAIVMFFFLEETPQGRVDGIPDVSAKPKRAGRPFTEVLLLTFSNRSLWLLGISLGLLNACRYGFIDWGVTHLTAVQETGVGKAALKYAVLPVGAIAGSYLAGWATDRFFGSRRAPVTCILLLLLAALTLMYDAVARISVPGTMFLLLLIGFCIYGPQVLLVGTAPADLAKKGTSAAAAGFVNCMGYVGAATGDVFTARMLGDTYDWQRTIYLWAAWAVGAAIAAGLLWNATSPDASTTETVEPGDE